MLKKRSRYLKRRKRKMDFESERKLLIAKCTHCNWEGNLIEEVKYGGVCPLCAFPVRFYTYEEYIRPLVPNLDAANVICQNCNTTAVLVDGKEKFPQSETLHGSKFYDCPACGSWIGCIPGTIIPYGNLVNYKVANARIELLSLIDKIVANCGYKCNRETVYNWLADKTGIIRKYFYIERLGEEQLKLCSKILKDELK